MVLCSSLCWFGEMTSLLLKLAREKTANFSYVFYLDTFSGDSRAATCLERLLVTGGRMLFSREKELKVGGEGTLGKPLSLGD